MRGKTYLAIIIILLAGCAKTKTYRKASGSFGSVSGAAPEVEETIQTDKEIVRKLTNKVKARCVRVINVHEVVFDVLGEKRSGGLLGIYGPTPDDPRISVRRMGDEAAEILRKKIEKKEIYIEFDHGENYKNTRWRVYIYLPEGDFINADLVLEGYARVHNRAFKYRSDLMRMEEYARAHKNGFWKRIAEAREKKKKK